jgi:hypothetical protein
MSEKNEALQYVKDIKSALLDKDSFFPYNYNALIVWGIIGSIMTFVMPGLIKSSILYGTIFSVVMMSIGFMTEGMLIKKVNADYDIESCTKKQKFISKMYFFLTLFAVTLSALFAKYDLIIPLFALWLFLCGFGDYAVGYILNIRIFSIVSNMSMGTSVLLVVAMLFSADLSNMTSLLFYISEFASFLLLGIAPVVIAMKLKGEK